MSKFINSFRIDVPELSATIYDIDPQPADNSPWEELDKCEKATRSETNGGAQRYSENGRWYVVAVEPSNPVESFQTYSGIRLSKEKETTIGGSQGKYRDVILGELRNSLEWYLTEQLDYWEKGNTQKFYERDSSDVIKGHDAYHGYKTKFSYDGDFYLTLDPTVKFISSLSVGDYLEKFEGKRSQVEDRVLNRNCTLMSKDRPTVELVSIADDETVSDDTMTINGEKKSVIEYVENDYKYPESQINQIDEDESVARIQFYWQDSPSDSVPSLLHPNPEDMTYEMTKYSAFSAKDRWEKTKELINKIDYFQIFNSRCDVYQEPKERGVDTLNYPSLEFGQNNTLSIGSENAVDRSQIVNPRNWQWVIRDYMAEFGAVKRYRGAQNIDILHPDGREDTARELYEELRKYIENYTGVRTYERPGTASHEDYQSLRKWLQRNGEDSDGVFILLNEYNEDYKEIIAELDGIPAQGIEMSTYRETLRSDGFSGSLFNTAIGLAAKMDIRPFLLAKTLSCDAYFGMSVTGDEVNNAAAVILSGENGDLLYQTETNVATGSSTVTGTEVATRMIRQGFSEVLDQNKLSQPETIAVHRNGQFGDGEIKGIRQGIEELKKSGDLPQSTNWHAVEISDNSPYRIYDSQKNECSTGDIVRLDSNNVLVTTHGTPQTHQGTPQPLYCTVKEYEGAFSSNNVATDVFALSFLNWGSPMMKMKAPLSTKLPSEMHDILSTGTRLPYPPF
jgi:hypothetical protein